MSATNITEIADQVQKFWSPLFVPELKEKSILPALLSSDYEGEIKQGGDTVYVSMVQAALGSRTKIDSSGKHTVIESEKLKTQRIAITADQIFSASFELDSLTGLQSQLDNPESDQKIRNALLKGIELKINEYVYSLVNPTNSTGSISTFDEDTIINLRNLASQLKWDASDKFLLLDPIYYGQFLKITNMTSKDFVGDQAKVGGQLLQQRYGFNVLEDNSDAMAQLSPTAAASKLALAFTKSFMYLVHQTQPTFKVSDLHSAKQRGFLITCDLIGGAKLGLEGAKKHIKNYNV